MPGAGKPPAHSRPARSSRPPSAARKLVKAELRSRFPAYQTWTCSYCSQSNDIKERNCSKCHCWNCPACGYLANGVGMETDAVGARAANGASSCLGCGSWMCSSCGKANDPQYHSCAACGRVQGPEIGGGVAGAKRRVRARPKSAAPRLQQRQAHSSIKRSRRSFQGQAAPKSTNKQQTKRKPQSAPTGGRDQPVRLAGQRQRQVKMGAPTRVTVRTFDGRISTRMRHTPVRTHKQRNNGDDYNSSSSSSSSSSRVSNNNKPELEDASSSSSSSSGGGGTGALGRYPGFEENTRLLEELWGHAQTDSTGVDERESATAANAGGSYSAASRSASASGSASASASASSYQHRLMDPSSQWLRAKRRAVKCAKAIDRIHKARVSDEARVHKELARHDLDLSQRERRLEVEAEEQAEEEAREEAEQLEREEQRTLALRKQLDAVVTEGKRLERTIDRLQNEADEIEKMAVTNRALRERNRRVDESTEAAAVSAAAESIVVSLGHDSDGSDGGTGGGTFITQVPAASSSSSASASASASVSVSVSVQAVDRLEHGLQSSRTDMMGEVRFDRFKGRNMVEKVAAEHGRRRHLHLSADDADGDENWRAKAKAKGKAKGSKSGGSGLYTGRHGPKEREHDRLMKEIEEWECALQSEPSMGTSAASAGTSVGTGFGTSMSASAATSTANPNQPNPRVHRWPSDGSNAYEEWASSRILPVRPETSAYRRNSNGNHSGATADSIANVGEDYETGLARRVLEATKLADETEWRKRCLERMDERTRAWVTKLKAANEEMASELAELEGTVKRAESEAIQAQAQAANRLVMVAKARERYAEREREVEATAMALQAEVAARAVSHHKLAEDGVAHHRQAKEEADATIAAMLAQEGGDGSGPGSVRAAMMAASTPEELEAVVRRYRQSNEQQALSLAVSAEPEPEPELTSRWGLVQADVSKLEHALGVRLRSAKELGRLAGLLRAQRGRQARAEQERDELQGRLRSRERELAEVEAELVARLTAHKDTSAGTSASASTAGEGEGSLSALEQYRALMEMAFADGGVDAAEDNQLEGARIKYGISQQQHEQLWGEVSSGRAQQWARHRHLIGQEAQGRDLDSSTQLAQDGSDISVGDLLLVLRSNGKWTYAELVRKSASEVSLSVDPTSKATKLVPSQDWATELRKLSTRLPAETRVLGVHTELRQAGWRLQQARDREQRAMRLGEQVLASVERLAHMLRGHQQQRQGRTASGAGTMNAGGEALGGLRGTHRYWTGLLNKVRALQGAVDGTMPASSPRLAFAPLPLPGSHPVVLTSAVGQQLHASNQTRERNGTCSAPTASHATIEMEKQMKCD